MKVKKVLFSVSMIFISILIYSLCVCPLNATAAEKVYRLKIQSAFPRGDLAADTLKDFAEAVAKRSKGRIKLSVFADPEIVQGEQVFEATQRGTLDMLHCIGAYWGGIVPIGEAEFGLPLMYNKPGGKGVKENSDIVRNFFYDSGFVDLLREEYGKHGLYYLDMHSTGEIFTLMTKPFKTCKAIKGKKFRVEGVWGDFYNNLGARGTFIPGTDAYMGLKLGTIDASMWDVSAITGLKWHEVAPYWLRGGGNDATPGQILVNMKIWNELPDDLKKALADAAHDYYKILINKEVKEMENVMKLVKQGKITEVYLDPECEKKYLETAYQLWDKMSDRDPALAKAVQLVKSWRKTRK